MVALALAKPLPDTACVAARTASDPVTTIGMRASLKDA